MVHTHLQQKLKEGGFEPYKTGHVFWDLRCPVDHVDHCSWGSPKKTLLPRAMHVFPSSTCCASTWIQRIQRPIPGVSSIIFRVQMFCDVNPTKEWNSESSPLKIGRAPKGKDFFQLFKTSGAKRLCTTWPTCSHNFNEFEMFTSK